MRRATHPRTRFDLVRPLHVLAAMTHARLGDLLVESGAIGREAAEHAALEARRTGRQMGGVLIDSGVAGEHDVYRALASQRGRELCEDVEGLLEMTDPQLSRKVPPRFLDRQKIMPLARRGARVVAATADPDVSVPELATALDAEGIDICVVTPTDFRRLRTAVDLGLLERGAPPARIMDAVRDLMSKDASVDAGIVALFHAILLDAIAERASDVHLEIYGERVRVRLRIDGDLRDARHFSITRDQLKALINVVKISADLDIAEHRVPQGGRFSTKAGGHFYDLRVQTQPSLHGEHTVIRLLPQDTQVLGIEDLGFPLHLARTYRRLIDSPQGLVLVVGPTGSGKSTTLYAALQVLARDPTRKVITIEDPIEYAIENVQQTQVHPEVGFGFATAMRSFVRQDPDVILVGEIRDQETAMEALRASQTGHLVLSTLHSNDSVDAVQRLVDLGMHANSVASELIAVFAQRLAKRICEGCRARVEPTPELLAEVFPSGRPADAVFFGGRGCARCNGAGTRGRIAVVEHLPVGPRIRRAIAHALPVDELREVAVGAGLDTMRNQGLALVREGVISLSELPAMLPIERLSGERRTD